MVFEDPALAPYRGSEPYIFLSYSHRNADRAAGIIRQLNRAGFRVWYDEGLIPGREWDENIARIIMGCSYFISLLTREYLASSNCKDELNFARDKNRPMLLIYLDEVSLPAGMELRLGRLFAVHRERCSSEEVFYSKIFSADGIARCNQRVSAAASAGRKRSSPTASSSVRAGVSQTQRREAEDEEPRRSALPVFGVILLLALLAGIAVFLYHSWPGSFSVPDPPVAPAPVQTSLPENTDNEAELDIEFPPAPEPSIITQPLAEETPAVPDSSLPEADPSDVGQIEPDPSPAQEDSVFIDPNAEADFSSSGEDSTEDEGDSAVPEDME